MTISAYANV